MQDTDAYFLMKLNMCGHALMIYYPELSTFYVNEYVMQNYTYVQNQCFFKKCIPGTENKNMSHFKILFKEFYINRKRQGF